MSAFRAFPTFRLVLAVGLALIAVCAWLDPPRPTTEVTRYVVPAGTAARVQAGERVDDVLPSVVRTQVGRRLVVTNEDTVSHVFGPFVLAPGQTWTREFAVAGRVAMACSVYPETGFVVDVSPASGALGLTWAVWRLLLVLGLLAVGLVSALLVRWQVDSPHEDPPAVAGAVLDTTLTREYALSRAVVALTLLAVVAETTWYARFAGWSTAVATTTSRAAPLAAVVVLVIAFLIRQVAAGRLPARPWLSLASRLPLIASGILLTSTLGFRAWPAALTVVGFGFVVWGAVGWVSRTGSTAPARSAIVALAGALLMAMGWLPAQVEPPMAALLGALHFVLGASLLFVPAGTLERRSMEPDERLTATWKALREWLAIAALYGVLTVLGALVVHVSATTLPLAGNPVRPDRASIQRGAELWQARCAGCHATALELSGESDQALLQLITSGRGSMPGYAYELDIDARGDLVNYLRSR